MERLYDYPKLEDTSDLTGLSFFGKLRAIYNGWRHSSGRAEAQKAKDLEELMKAELVLQADLFLLLHKATEPIRRGKKHSVIVDIASQFSPVLDTVLESRSITAFYNVTIINRPNPDLDIAYLIRVRLEAR